MRIISGSSKRRFIKTPSSSTGVRPILGRIKKSLFDILRPRIGGATFLDLYAGSGAVGIEALSSGAESVTFVDRNPNCLSVIRQNLSKLQMFSRSRIVKADITKSLSSVGGPFDLIFMGPPYHDDKWNAFHLTQPTLQEISRCGLLKEGGLVIGQHHAKENPVNLPNWKKVREEFYGDTILSFFQLI